MKESYANTSSNVNVKCLSCISMHALSAIKPSTKNSHPFPSILSSPLKISFLLFCAHKTFLVFC